MTEFYYRYYEYSNGTIVSLQVSRHEVVKHTPAGVWVYRHPSLDLGFHQTHETKPTPTINHMSMRWVSNSTKKRFVHSTKTQALQAFIYRKKCHLAHLNAKVRDVRGALKLAEAALDSTTGDIPSYYDNIHHNSLQLPTICDTLGSTLNEGDGNG